MAKNFTINDIINSPVGHLNEHLKDKPQEKPAIKQKRLKKRSKEKDWLSTQLWAWGREKGLELILEHPFHPARKYRFDFSFIDESKGLKVAIEYEGIFNTEKSRHTTVKGYSQDTDKYRDAALLGWTVLRYTALNYKTVISDLDKIFLKKSCESLDI